MHELEKQDIALIGEADIDWRKFDGKIIAVSGGTGFLGKFVTEVIKYRVAAHGQDIRVVCLSRHPLQDEDNVKYVCCDLSTGRDAEICADFIMHLASNTHPQQYASDPVGTIMTNVYGCKTLLDAAVRNKARFLLASSVEIYGECDGEIRENDCGYIDCNTARAGYNEAKRVCESLVQSYRAQYGADCVIARLARCFGADRKKDTKALAQFFADAVAGRNIVLKSRGEQRYSYLYVADAAYALLKILADGKDGEAYNAAGDFENITLGGYARLIASFAGVAVEMSGSGQTGASRAQNAVLNCDKLKSLGWQPKYGVSAAMRRTYDVLRGLPDMSS